MRPLLFLRPTLFLLTLPCSGKGGRKELYKNRILCRVSAFGPAILFSSYEEPSPMAILASPANSWLPPPRSSPVSGTNPVLDLFVKRWLCSKGRFCCGCPGVKAPRSHPESCPFCCHHSALLLFQLLAQADRPRLCPQVGT